MNPITQEAENCPKEIFETGNSLSKGLVEIGQQTLNIQRALNTIIATSAFPPKSEEHTIADALYSHLAATCFKPIEPEKDLGGFVRHPAQSADPLIKGAFAYKDKPLAESLGYAAFSLGLKECGHRMHGSEERNLVDYWLLQRVVSGFQVCIDPATNRPKLRNPFGDFARRFAQYDGTHKLAAEKQIRQIRHAVGSIRAKLDDINSKWHTQAAFNRMPHTRTFFQSLYAEFTELHRLFNAKPEPTPPRPINTPPRINQKTSVFRGHGRGPGGAH